MSRGKKVTEETQRHYWYAFCEIAPKTGILADLIDRFTFEDVVGKWRKKELIMLRHSYAYFLREILGYTYPHIATLLSRDHSSIIHAVESIADYSEYDKICFQCLQAVKDMKSRVRANNFHLLSKSEQLDIAIHTACILKPDPYLFADLMHTGEFIDAHFNLKGGFDA